MADASAGRTTPSLLLLNEDKGIAQTHAQSLEYLDAHPELRELLSAHIHAYYEIGDLVPQTIDNFASGHYFPYTQSYTEVENACQLALRGFYKYGFVALRSALELGILGAYLAVEDREQEEVQDWIRSRALTPWLAKMIHRLRRMDTFSRFDEVFTLGDRLLQTHDDLSAFTHTRGYAHSSQALNRANVCNFSQASLIKFCDSLFHVVEELVVVMLLKYPVGMQGLPIEEKYGIEGPMGGFLREYQVERMTSVLPPDEKELLQRLSNEDAAVAQTVRHFQSLPDISQEEFEKQLAGFQSESGPRIKS